MRAPTDSAAMFLAPPQDPATREHETVTAEASSVFAATLGLVSTSGPAKAPPEENDRRGDGTPMVEATPVATLQLAPIVPPPTPAAKSATVAENTDAPWGIEEIGPRPSPNGIDLSSFDLTTTDQPVALPLEAALQQLTSTLDSATVAPQAAPTRVITASHEVVEVVTRHVVGGDHQITMVLKPASLGEVKVRVQRLRDEQVTVTLETERPEATALLRERVPELQAALQQQGVSVRSIDVSLQASDGMSQRGAGGESQTHHQHAEREETNGSEETLRTPKRTKRNTKDLDVLV